MMRIEGKVAVITGGASGIGRAVCAELAIRRAKYVAMVDMHESVAEEAEKLVREYPHTVVQAFQGDVTNDEFRSGVFDTICAEHDSVNICVPAAGIVRDALAVKLDRTTGKASLYPVDTFRKVTEINYIAPIYWAIETVARMAESRFSRGLKRWGPHEEEPQGAIIFIGSVASQGNKGQISYASAKSGLEGAAATLMKEAMYHGVRCGVIHPGFTDTPILSAMGEEYLREHVLPGTQLGRLIRPAEIADAICFMISNSAVSGELWADAGWHPTAA
jgi:NAD(P)-dependent dehydrogenase (short-subunit alcohol dehydrogenase family)